MLQGRERTERRGGVATSAAALSDVLGRVHQLTDLKRLRIARAVVLVEHAREHLVENVERNAHGRAAEAACKHSGTEPSLSQGRHAPVLRRGRKEVVPRNHRVGEEKARLASLAPRLLRDGELCDDSGRLVANGGAPCRLVLLRRGREPVAEVVPPVLGVVVWDTGGIGKRAREVCGGRVQAHETRVVQVQQEVVVAIPNRLKKRPRGEGHLGHGEFDSGKLRKAMRGWWGDAPGSQGERGRLPRRRDERKSQASEEASHLAVEGGSDYQDR